MKKIIAGFAAAVLSISAFALEADIANNEKVEKVESITSVANTKGTKIYVVGDSTLSAFNDPYYMPRYGYGTRIQDYIDPKKAEVINLAMSGRSSKSFLTEANYQTLKSNIKKGDYLIIGFGHNDEKAEEARYTNPNGSKEEAGSFQNSLYENYVKLAKSKKATPILCTPIVRRSAKNLYEGSVVHITADAPGFPGGDYPKAIRELGKETKTLVVDLTQITKDRYESLSADETANFHAHPSHVKGSVDNTHLNYYGAALVAYDVVDAAAKANKKFAKLLNGKTPASKEELLKLSVNPKYVIPAEFVYAPFNPEKDASSTFKTTSPWYGTVFGVVGGKKKITNPTYYGISENDGKVLIHSGTTNGKRTAGQVSDSADGIAFYFQKVDISKDFNFTATAKVLSAGQDDQVAFGLMARDDVYIDRDDKIASDYVAAGGYKFASSSAENTSWTRSDKAIKATPASSQKIAKDTVVNLSISKQGKVYTVKCGSDPAVRYTADLNKVDADNIYVGLFTARSAYIEFSNISLTVK